MSNTSMTTLEINRWVDKLQKRYERNVFSKGYFASATNLGVNLYTGTINRSGEVIGVCVLAMVHINNPQPDRIEGSYSEDAGKILGIAEEEADNLERGFIRASYEYTCCDTDFDKIGYKLYNRLRKKGQTE